MQSKKVGLKLCGHCSPRADMVALEEALKQEADDMDFVYYLQDALVQSLLILNACESACAKHPPFDGPVIVVTPETVDCWPVDSGQMTAEILKRLRSASE